MQFGDLLPQTYRRILQSRVEWPSAGHRPARRSAFERSRVVAAAPSGNDRSATSTAMRLQFAGRHRPAARTGLAGGPPDGSDTTAARDCRYLPIHKPQSMVQTLPPVFEETDTTPESSHRHPRAPRHPGEIAGRPAPAFRGPDASRSPTDKKAPSAPAAPSRRAVPNCRAPLLLLADLPGN